MFFSVCFVFVRIYFAVRRERQRDILHANEASRVTAVRRPPRLRRAHVVAQRHWRDQTSAHRTVSSGNESNNSRHGGTRGWRRRSRLAGGPTTPSRRTAESRPASWGRPPSGDGRDDERDQDGVWSAAEGRRCQVSDAQDFWRDDW